MTDAAQTIRDAIADWDELSEVWVTSDTTKDGSVWVGIALTEEEAEVLAGLIQERYADTDDNY